MAVFAKQGIIKKDIEESGRTFINPSEEWEIQEDIEIQQKNYEYIMEIILKVIGDKNYIILEELVNYIMEDGEESILDHRFFYDFWILLHYNSPIKIEKEASQNIMLEKVVKLLEENYTQLEVVEIGGTVQPNLRYTIRNMKLSLEVKNSAI